MHSFHVDCPWSLSRDGEVRISRRHYLPEAELLPADEANLRARAHPRGVAYRAPAGARALAHAVENPGCVISGFGALALHGLPYLVEGHDTLLVAPRATNQVGDEHRPAVRRRGCRPSEVWTFHINGYPFRVACPAAATIQALKEIPREELPAVQLLDCVRRFLGAQPSEIFDAGRHRLSKEWLQHILRLSSPHPDSPKETEMRLLVEEVANRFGLTVREQHPVHQSGRLITVFDLALIEPRVGIMYDGRHHWDYQQRQKDALINLDVTAEGWTPLRFSSGTLPELPARLERLLSDKYRAGGKPTWGK
ncbi:hypothetical protein [Corynebacterium senegalense]|uniref:hypothetical protein n=1 Tax=Corynebacterium senegalense TaxID=2080750 RepID=UPI000E1FCA04|nr:hypothetical protein [Corynebacterium senegalense]